MLIDSELHLHVILTHAEPLTFLAKQVTHARGAGAMTQELVKTRFTPKHRHQSDHTVLREKDPCLTWTGFPESRKLHGKGLKVHGKSVERTSGQNLGHKHIMGMMNFVCMSMP